MIANVTMTNRLNYLIIILAVCLMMACTERQQ